MFLSDVVSSVARPARYAEFARQPGGRALAYLLLIALPLAAVGAVRMADAVVLSSDMLARAVARFPDFRIVDGVLEFDGPQPYHLRLDNGTVVGIVDTTGATDRSALAGHQQFILVLRDRIIIRNAVRVEEIFYADLGIPPGEAVTRAGVSGFFSRLAAYGPAFGVVWAAGSLLAKVFAALFLAVATLVVAQARGRAATLRNTWGIACHALTLPLLAAFARVLANVPITAFGLFYWGAALVYCLTAVGLLPGQTAGAQAAGPAAPPGPQS